MIGGIIQRDNGKEMFVDVAGVRCSTQSILRGPPGGGLS